jgi:pimeloyl-ACP methyl ester carboxylesterase
VILSGEESGEGPPIVLLHGLTATRRYVVMGSRLLERSGYRVISYDARGHGRSSAAPDPGAYGYEDLAGDLGAVMDALEIPRAILAGASMGAHTILAFALEHPERVAALGVVTPAYHPEGEEDGEGAGRPASMARPGATESAPPGRVPAARDALARGLREGGVDGFLRAYDLSAVPGEWRETVERVVRQRLGAHEHPGAVADALEVVSRSRPFPGWSDLDRVTAPTVVVGSRDEVDPGHPLALAERYAAAIPGATFEVEEGGPPVRSPLAWQGGRLSKILLELAERAGLPSE